MLTNTVTPMVICHLLNQFMVVTATNCFTYGHDDDDAAQKSTDQRSKPVQLYGRLLDLYGQTDLCVMDACGANGKCLNYVTCIITMFPLFPSFQGDLLFVSVIMKQPHAECHMLLVLTLFMP